MEKCKTCEAVYKKEEAAKVALQLLKEVYIEEHSRYEFLITKTQTLATLASIVFAGMAIIRFSEEEPITISAISLIASLITILLCCFKLIPSKLARIRYKAINEAYRDGQSAQDMAENLLHDFEKCIGTIHTENEKKFNSFSVGLACFMVSTVMAGLAISLQLL